MARRARLVLPGVPMHVIQRGNNRGSCFLSDGNRLCYLHLLSRLAEDHECAVHAYVLMTNHVHLLLTPTRADSVARLMKHLGQRYVQYFNKAYNRSGSIWQGRFGSSLVETETYLLTCQRYIELNPVRAGMVARPEDYRWSSFSANAAGNRSTLLTPHALYLALGSAEEERLAAYRALFAEAPDADFLQKVRGAARGGFVLGTEQFQRKVESALGRPATARKSGPKPLDVWNLSPSWFWGLSPNQFGVCPRIRRALPVSPDP